MLLAGHVAVTRWLLLVSTLENSGSPMSFRPERIFEVGGFRVDAARRCLSGQDGAPIELPSRAFDLLLFMVERPGEMLDKQTLLKAAWPTTVVEDSNLSQCMFLLRRALGDTASEQRFILTVPGRGSSGHTTAPVVAPRAHGWRWVLVATALLLVVIGYLSRPRNAASPPVTATSPAVIAPALKSV